MTKRFAPTRTMALLALVAALGGCGDETVVRAGSARVVVDAAPVDPLGLIVSTDFVVGSGNAPPQLLQADTVSIESDFDHTYDLDDDDPKIYVRLYNPGFLPEVVRLTVFLDETVAFDASSDISGAVYVEYTYTVDDGN